MQYIKKMHKYKNFYIFLVISKKSITFARLF